jgi:hypothetical protein
MPDDDDFSQLPEAFRVKAQALIEEAKDIGRMTLETAAVVTPDAGQPDAEDWEQIMDVVEIGAMSMAIALSRHDLLRELVPVEIDSSRLMTLDEYRLAVGRLLNALVYRNDGFPEDPRLLRALEVIVDGADVYADARVMRYRAGQGEA